MRAPEAPMGWPRAQAPPLTLSFSCGMPRSRMAIMATTAKASLTSKRSTSSTLQPARSRACRMAGTGAVVKSPGSWAWAPWPAMRATGVRPRRSAVEARISTRAAAPSEIEEALAAVIAPSLAKAGFRVGILAGSAFSGCSSSRLTVSTPLRPAISTGTISRSKAPLSTARRARQALDGVGVHVGAGELIGGGGLLGEGAHQLARLVGVLQAVEVHGIHHPVVADAGAGAVLGQQVGRVGHALHAAGDHDHVAEPAARASWARMAACMPEPHILLTVVACTEVGRPAPRAPPDGPAPGPGPPAARSP